MAESDEPGRAMRLPQAAADAVPFPHSRVRPPSSAGAYNDLGPGKMSQTLGVPTEQLSGHWCSRCQGIWFGFLLEIECPNCGSRRG